MKTTPCFVFSLLTLVTLTFMPHSFAQNTNPEYVVRVIYFIPNDREPQPNIDTKLDAIIKEGQQFYANHMEAHGFGRKTFRFEADDTGNVVVHHVNGKFNDAYYQKPSVVGDLFNELEEQFDTSKNIYIIALEISRDDLGPLVGTPDLVAGLGSGNSLAGFALLVAGRINPKPWDSPEDRGFQGVLFHELGHAFGLDHDYRSNRKLISSSGYTDTMTTSFCAARWLDVHRYFNTTQKPFNQNTEIRMLTPSLASPPNVIRFRFEITDPDGLHQVLLKHETGYSNNYVDYGVTAYQQVSGEKSTIEIMATQLIGSETEVSLRVIDRHGNFTDQLFQEIDINSLLPQPEAISIPDMNLRKAVRETLGLPPEDTITQLDMLKLRSLSVWNQRNSDRSKQITNLIGLEHAKNLVHLDCYHNQVSDIKPLIGLPNLRSLYIGGNQIRDVTDFEKMLNLEKLVIEGNPIEDIAPLLVLFNQKPSIKIYLREDKPLPVNLSHFRAMHTNAGVILKWTTESEVDNAGFYIYRSETKDDDFKVVNPTMIQGAGTTGKRNEYTWTDTTAKPNTVYYYRIEDVSHAGVREQLATVRLRGLVSAKGKLTMRWADLKMQR